MPCSRPSRQRSPGVAGRGPASVSLPRRAFRRRSDLGGALRKGEMGFFPQPGVELLDPARPCFGSGLVVKRGEVWTRVGLLRTAFSRLPPKAFILLYTLFS